MLFISKEWKGSYDCCMLLGNEITDGVIRANDRNNNRKIKKSWWYDDDIGYDDIGGMRE